MKFLLIFCCVFSFTFANPVTADGSRTFDNEEAQSEVQLFLSTEEEKLECGQQGENSANIGNEEDECDGVGADGIRELENIETSVPVLDLPA